MNGKNKRTVSTLTDGQTGARRVWVRRTLYITIGICLCLAWEAPIRHAVGRRLWTRPVGGERDAYEFIALAYTQSPRTAATGLECLLSMDQHLDALTANGYTPITLADVINLLHRGTPLPRKAILLTLEGMNRELLQHARRAVRRYGWNGVVFFETDPLSGGRSDTTEWKTVRALQKSKAWEIGLQGHQAGLAVLAGTGEEQAHFLTSRMRVEGADRIENDAEFETRVQKDYETACALAAAKLPRVPIAFAYPSGDFGQYARADELPAHVNLGAAARFEVAFTLGTMGRNTMFADRRRINRLHVDPSWTAAELLAAIQTTDRKIESVEDVDLTLRAAGWITDRGRAAIGDGGLELTSDSGSGDARVWLGGSDIRRDFSASMDFRILRGKAQFYARAERDRVAYLLIEFDGDGNAVLKQKSVFAESPVTLAVARTAVRGSRQHRLALFMRDNNINVTVDGLPVFNTHQQATGLKTGGMLGVAVCTDTPDGKAALTIDNVVLQNRRSTLASWNFDVAFDPYVLKWIRTHGSRLTEISPPLERLQNAEPAQNAAQTAAIYRQLARIYNLRLTPCIRISSDRELAAWTPVSLAGTLNDLDCDGLYVNFENYDNVQINVLESWLRQTGKMLSGAGRPVLVRLPRMLEHLTAVYSLLALIPSVEIVTDTNTLMPVAAAKAKQIHEEIIAPPTPVEMTTLPPVYTIEENGSGDLRKTIETRISELIEAGETAFRRGTYEGAIAAFSEWHRLAPTSPAPPRRIGDALINLGYHDEAVGFYKQSLGLDPGQITLATQFARLLADTGRKTDARNILNTYARLFPDSNEVLLAQAEWLYQENRTGEAAERAERILRLDPDHFEATLFTLRIADDEVSRTEVIERLMNITRTPEQQYNLISAIWSHDLLTYPNSHLFVAAMDKIAKENKDPRIREMIARLEPLTTTVTEDFRDAATLSKNWQIEGAGTSIINGELQLDAVPARNELSARLLRSERWRDSFIEASITDTKGGFWLYGRRSRSHLVRFGFDEAAGRLNIQIWKGRNHDVVANNFLPWSFPTGGCTLRLEIRGKGVSGLVNDKPVFEVPLPLPEDFGLGWTALAVNSPERGTAKATLSRLSSGPIPMRLAVTPGSPADDDQGRQTDNLRSLLPLLTDISPEWFSVDAAGSWNSTVNEESDFFRLFARYHRLRLTPVVRVTNGVVIAAEDIITICRTHAFDGFVLWFDTMPEAEWFDTMDRALNAPGLDIVAIAPDSAGDTGSIRGIAASRTLFKAYGSAVPARIIRVDNPEAAAGTDAKTTTDPVVFRF